MSFARVVRRGIGGSIPLLALLAVIVGVAWWWFGGEAMRAAAVARSDESDEAPPAAPAASALVATTDRVVEAERAEAPEFDDQHYVRIPARVLQIHVLDEHDRNPIEDATFSLDRHETAGLPPLGEARSGSDGRATFTVPTDRKLHLTVTAEGFTPEVVLVPDEPLGTLEQPLEIALERGASIHGRLFGPDGEPVSGERVRLQPFQWFHEQEWGFAHAPAFPSPIRIRQVAAPPSPARDGREVRTTPSRPDAPQEAPDNEFLFENVPSEVPIDLYASKSDDEGVFGSLTLYLDPGERRELEWRLGATSSIAGRIVDDAGAPVAGATVNALANARIGQPRADGPTSGANGEFELAGLDAGRCVLFVKPHGGGVAQESFECTLAPGESRRGVVIELLRAAPLIVRARLADGSAPVGMLARIRSPLDRRAVNEERTNETGAFVPFDAAPLGELEVEATTRGDSSPAASGRVRFLHDGAHECVVDCVAFASLRGSVESAPGKPVDLGVDVRLIERGTGETAPRLRANTSSKAGEFGFEPVRPGVYDLVAETTDGAIAIVPPLALAAGERREGLVVRVAPGATLRLVAPAPDRGTGSSLPSFHPLVVRVRRDGDCFAAAELAFTRSCELTVPPGKFAVELWCGSELLASRAVEARPFDIVRVRF